MIQVRIFLHSTNDFDSREIALNPDPSNLPPLDPKDALLLADPSTSTATFPMNGNASNPVQPTLANVSWLRKTEYITRESSQRQIGQEPYVFICSPCFPVQTREFLQETHRLDVYRRVKKRTTA